MDTTEIPLPEPKEGLSESPEQGTFYATTPIFYVNAEPPSGMPIQPSWSMS